MSKGKPQGGLESILMVSNRRPKSNFSNAKVMSNKFTDITLEQANEMLADNPKVFMI